MEDNRQYIQEQERLEAPRESLTTHKFKVGEVIEYNGALRRIIGFDREGYFWEYYNVPSGDFNFFTSLNEPAPQMDN